MQNFLVELLPTFIGAFLAFLSALLVQTIDGRKKEKELRKSVEKSIREELKSIKASLEEAKGDNSLYFRYNCPVWEMCINSGYLFSLSGNKLCLEFEKIYMNIESANNIEKEYFSASLSNNAPGNLIYRFDQERRERRERILKGINKVLNEL